MKFQKLQPVSLNQLNLIIYTKFIYTAYVQKLGIEPRTQHDLKAKYKNEKVVVCRMCHPKFQMTQALDFWFDINLSYTSKSRQDTAPNPISMQIHSIGKTIV